MADKISPARTKFRVSPFTAWPAFLADERTSIDILRHRHLTVARDWHIGPRLTGHHFVHYLSSGNCIGTVQGETVHLGPGGFLYVAPWTPYQLQTIAGLTPPTLYALRFTVSRGDVPWRPREDVLQLLQARELQAVLALIFDEFNAALDQREAHLQWLFALLFSTALRLRDAVGTGRNVLSESQRQRLYRAVDGRHAQRPSSADLARAVGLSGDYFARVFRRTFGVSPRAWLLRERMQHAAHRLLESPKRIGVVANDLGYDNLYLFSRQFRQVLGCSPRQYRQRH